MPSANRASGVPSSRLAWLHEPQLPSLRLVTSPPVPARGPNRSGVRSSAPDCVTRADAGAWTLVGRLRRAGISPQYLSEVERGRKDPSSEVLAAISGALGCEGWSR